MLLILILLKVLIFFPTSQLLFFLMLLCSNIFARNVHEFFSRYIIIIIFIGPTAASQATALHAKGVCTAHALRGAACALRERAICGRAFRPSLYWQQLRPFSSVARVYTYLVHV